MKERSIIFNSETVKAILNGRKTQTRRTRGLGTINKDPNNWCLEWFNSGTGIASFSRGDIIDGVVEVTDLTVKCPYGQTGDRLWVRETWFLGGIRPKEWAWYKAGFEGDALAVLWRPSIHMPRWASRITREITKVRVERVQEITPHNCVTEGIVEEYGDGLALRDKFEALWDSLHAKPKSHYIQGKVAFYESYPWEDIQETRTYRGKPWYVYGNPWVWVIEFRQIQEEAPM